MKFGAGNQVFFYRVRSVPAPFFPTLALKHGTRTLIQFHNAKGGVLLLCAQLKKSTSPQSSV